MNTLLWHHGNDIKTALCDLFPEIGLKRSKFDRGNFLSLTIFGLHTIYAPCSKVENSRSTQISLRTVRCSEWIWPTQSWKLVQTVSLWFKEKYGMFIYSLCVLINLFYRMCTPYYLIIAILLKQHCVICFLRLGWNIQTLNKVYFFSFTKIRLII